MKSSIIWALLAELLLSLGQAGAAIKFTDQRMVATANNTAVMNNLQTASLFFWFRYEPGSSNQNSQIGCRVIGRRYNTSVAVTIGGTSQAPSGYVGVSFIFSDNANGLRSASANLAIGTSYPILLVYAKGQQTLYLPGQTIVFGNLTNPLKSGSYDFEVGGFPPGGPCSYTIGDVNSWSDYACNADDYRALVCGTDPITIGATASARYRWTLSGNSGATPSIGDPGLKEVYAGVHNLSSITGTGSSIYTDQLSFQPSVKLASKSRVGTSGQSLFLFFDTVGSQTETTPIAINTMPSLSVNGVSVGVPSLALCDGSRPFVVLNVPNGVQINPGDTVTLTAPALWLTTTAGSIGALSSCAILNKSGMSAFGTESLRKTLRLGMNFPHVGTNYYCLYYLHKNQVLRSTVFSNSLVDSDGSPISFKGISTNAFLELTSLNNLIDATGYPGQTGLRAIGWDSPISSNTTFSLTSGSPGTTTITERVDLANPGDASGNGRVRVFDVQQAEGSSVASLVVMLTCSQTSGTPVFSNLRVFGPRDFTYTDGQPVTLAPSNWWDISAITLDRFSTGLGSARFCDSTPSSNYTSEPWEIHNSCDFSWGNNCGKINRSIALTQARPYDIRVSPYVYAPPELLPNGVPYTATLAQSIDSLTMTLTISDAATAPVIPGLLLKIDNELMTVLSISGSTVTVYRGASNTIPAAHTAGPVQVQNRIAVSSLIKVASKGDQVVEVVSSSPHGLKSGMAQITLSGTWPKFTFTDGTTANIGNHTGCILVTGPNTFIVTYNYIANVTNGPVVLSQAYSLSNASITISLPFSGFPYEFTARLSGKFADCYHHVNIPAIASDTLVYEIARRIRDNLPSGRKVLVELSDEPWNWTWPTTQTFVWLSGLSFPGSGDPRWPWQVARTSQITQIFINVFNETGRGSEVIGLLNSMAAVATVTRDILDQVKAQGITVPLWIGVAPYVNPDNKAATVTAYNNATIEQVIDLWVHDLYYSPTSMGPALQKTQEFISAFNQETGKTCQLYAYECGVETCIPASANFPKERTRDAVYHPNWWIIEQDFYAWMQHQGFVRANIYAYDMVHVSNTNWGMYHGPAQPYGRGDGSGGCWDNRLCLTTPGQTYTKGPTRNQDQQNVSVRGSAFLNWMRSVKPPKP